MADIFHTGDPGSARVWTAALSTLLAQGQAVLDQCAQNRLETLIEFEQRMQALSGRRQRANRTAPPRELVSFVVSDFFDIDQTLTTATIRADAQSATLKERTVTTQATIKTQGFTPSSGTVEPISAQGSLFRVHTDDGTLPTGTFSLQLFSPLTLTLLVFDLSALASQPDIVVSASTDGVVYTPARKTEINGDRLTAWFDPLEMLYIQLAITPTHPDTLGGTSYTFGLLDFSGSTTEFQLISELVTRPIPFSPQGTSVVLEAPADPDIAYFLSFDGGAFLEYPAGSTLVLPGTQAVTASSVAMDPGSGVLAYTWPATAYGNSLAVSLDGDDSPVRVAPGLSPHDPAVVKLVGRYLAVNGSALSYVRDDISVDIGKTFSFSYVTGPATMTVQLKVLLTTSDRAVTPKFTGAALQEI